MNLAQVEMLRMHGLDVLYKDVICIHHIDVWIEQLKKEDADRKQERNTFEEWRKNKNPSHLSLSGNPADWMFECYLEGARQAKVECADLCEQMVLYTGLDCADAIRRTISESES